jgi:hypothetical protein
MIVARAGTAGQEPGRLCKDTHPRTKTYDCLDMLCLVFSPSLISTDSYHLSVRSGLFSISLALNQVSSSVDEANEHKQAHTPPTLRHLSLQAYATLQPSMFAVVSPASFSRNN